MIPLKFILLLVTFSVTAIPTFAADDPVYTGFFSSKALSGYDPVAYFVNAKAKKGNSKYSYKYRGAVWLFSSEGNRTKFIAAPEKYAPQYGGYCAWAVSEKKSRAPGNPHHWKIVNNKLYLNYDESVQDKWNLDIPRHIKQADKYWPEVAKN